MEDESLSSVDQFLRDNGFSISDTALGLASLSGDELLDDELLLSDAEERQTSSSECNSTNQSPRFVLLEDEGLLLDRRDDRDGARHDQTDRVTNRPVLQDQGQPEPGLLDSSVFYEGSELSQAPDTPRMNSRDRETASVASSSSSSFPVSSLLQLGKGQDSTSLSSVYQLMPQQKEMERVAMVSAASSVSLPPSLSPSSDSYSGSSVSLGRVLDDELNDALGMPRSMTGADRLSLSSRVSREEERLLHVERTADEQYWQTQQSTTLCTSRTQSELVTDNSNVKCSTNDIVQDEHAVKLTHGSDGHRSRRNRRQSKENVLIYEKVDEKKEDNDDTSTRYGTAKSDQNPKRDDAVVIDQGAWNGLNDLLRKNGLSAVRFYNDGLTMLPDRESLFSVIHDFGVQLEDKDSTIEDLVLASKRNSRVQSRRESELRTIEKKNEETRKALDKAKSEIQRLKALQKKENESTELLSKKLKNSCLRLQQQLKVSEHRVKAKEIIIEKLQSKLQQQVDKEALNKMRDRRAFRSLQDRDPRRTNPRDIQALETISMYEAQREQMQEEIDHLKSQVTALNSELRDKENFIARQARASLKNESPAWERFSDESYTGRVSANRLRNHQQYESSSVASDEVMLEQLEAARREQEVVAAKLRQREAVMVEKVAMIEQELLAARETIGKLKEENANLSLEADSRPSIRDYRLSQRRIRQLERQVAENKLALEEANDRNELCKVMGTKERVERDRLSHRLHLSRLDSLPRGTVLEVVKDVCRVLHLTDITLIAPSLDKICSVITAVPRMEKFIRDVCEFVFLHLNDNADISSVSFELEQVIPTLQLWTIERRKLHALKEFKTSIITELCKRTVKPGIVNDSEDISRDESPPDHPTTLARAIYIVSELVELEKGIMHHREMYTQAAAEVERRPNLLINQIVRHFSHVFQVKNIEGVLPKINEIYLHVNQMKNFLHATRDVLHLRKDTSLVHCLNVIKERLQEGAVDATCPHGGDTEEKNIYADKSQNFVVEKIRSQSSAREGNAKADLVGVQQVRRMSILIRKLKRELGAITMDDILPRTKRLMELLSMSNHNTDPEDDDEYA